MVLAVIALAAALSAREPQLPAGATCEQIREKVSEYGRAKAIMWAREHGFSWWQINEARKCLK